MRLLSLFFLSAIISNISKADTLSIGWELWYPYQYHNKQQKLDGIDIKITKEIIKQLNVKAAYIELPWERHLKYIESGDIQVAMGSSYTDAREKFAFYTKPYRKEQVNLYTLKNKELPIKTLDELINSPYIIGVEAGYYYGDDYQELINNPEFMVHISEVLDVEQNVKRLLSGKIDGLLVGPYTMKSFINKYHLDNEISDTPLVIYQTDIHFMLSKKSTNEQLLRQFNAVITNLRKTGRLDQLLVQ